MILKPIKNTRFLVLNIAIPSLVIIIFYLFVLRPESVVYGNFRSKLLQKKSEYKHALQCEQNLEGAKSELALWEGRLGDFSIEKEKAGGIAFEVKQIAGEAGVSDFSYEHGSGDLLTDIQGLEKISEGSIFVKFVSSFSQFTIFMNKLERHKPVIFIDKFSAERSEDGRQKVQMSLVFLARK